MSWYKTKSELIKSLRSSKNWPLLRQSKLQIKLYKMLREGSNKKTSINWIKKRSIKGRIKYLSQITNRSWLALRTNNTEKTKRKKLYRESKMKSMHKIKGKRSWRNVEIEWRRKGSRFKCNRKRWNNTSNLI